MIEYFLFCADDRPLQIAELATTLRDVNWSLHVARNWFVSEGIQLAQDGPLSNDDVTLGWPNDSQLATDFAAAVSCGNRKQVDEWIYDCQIGSGMWAAQLPFAFAEHGEFDSLDNAREQMGGQYVDHLSRSKVMYQVTNCPHMEFTAIIMGAAALLRKGMIEDPQLGLSIPAPDGVSQLTTYLDSWTEE